MTATTAQVSGPIVQVDDVWKLYKVGDDIVRAVAQVSFAVQRGEFVCLMGPSGSGKSTLLHILGGLDRPTKGAVALDGTPTTGLTESQFSALRHSTIGFIFQRYNLIPFLSAIENVELPLIFEPIDRSSLRARARDLLTMVGLGHRMDHTPNRMSGGEQQRVAIARALIGSPSLILADEPTGNLDGKTRAEIGAPPKDLCARMGVTVIASTHDPAVAAHATRVLRMHDGALVGEERPTPVVAD